MNEHSFAIQWVPVEKTSGSERIITSEEIITLTHRNEQNVISSSQRQQQYIDVKNSLQQIAAENLIFMAQDGQVSTLGGQIVTNIEYGLIDVDNMPMMQNSDDEHVISSANSSEFQNNNQQQQQQHEQQSQQEQQQQQQQYFECQVTEEVVTDDWVQQHGEERVEIPVEQIIDNQNIDEIDVPLPTDQDEYTALRPYPCDFCSRRFRKKSSLLAHMINHQNDRPHICNLCGARFVRRTDLLNHLRSHADDEQQMMQRQQNYDEISDNYKYLNTSGTDHFYENYWQSDYESSSVNTPKKVKNNKQGKNPVGRPRKHPVKIKEEKIDDEYNAPPGSHLLQNFDSYEYLEQKKPFVCGECGVAFAREKAFIAHLKIHKTETTYECANCNETFWDYEALNDHHRTHHFEASNSEYEPTGDETENSDSESRYGDYYCNFCGMSFHRQDLLKRHAKQHLKKETTTDHEIPIPKDSNDRHCCNVCGENFYEALDLLAHAEIHSRVQPCKCVLCGESFLDEVAIRKHLNEFHPDQMTVNSCVLCGKHCRDRKALIKHSWDHSREKSHPCSSCGKTFHNKARLKRHMVSHRNKTVECEICHEEFPDGRSLMNHRHSHSNKNGKLFECHECGKSFGSRSSQQIHIRIHTGERPYGCRFCWKAFADGGTLRKHERIHTGEKPYACAVCPRAFNQRVVLREHIRSHHSAMDSKRKTYYCEICSEDFETSSDLIQHLIQHSDMNTAMQREPITAPRKYKRRRKLKPHELERLRSERNANSDEIDCQDDIDYSTKNNNVVLDIIKTTTVPNVIYKKNKNEQFAVIKERKKVGRPRKTGINTLSSHWNTKLIKTSPKDSSNSNLENTSQNVDLSAVENKIKSKSNAKINGPKMIHTEKTRIRVEDGSSKRKTKTVITRGEPQNKQTTHEAKNYDFQTKDLQQNEAELQTEHLTLPIFGRRKRDFSTSDFDAVLPDEITSSPRPRNKSESQSDLYDAQLLLEAATINNDMDKLNHNDNYFEEILRSPERSSDNDIVEKRSGRRSMPNRKYLEFDTSPKFLSSPKTRRPSNPRFKRKLENQLDEDLLSKDMKFDNEKYDVTEKSSIKQIKQEFRCSPVDEILSQKRSNQIKTEFSVESVDGILTVEDSEPLRSTNLVESQKNYKCEMCSSFFPDRSSLLAHVNIHI